MKLKEIDKTCTQPPLFSMNGISQESLCVQLFELGKIFVERKMVKFYAQGTCMHPCIRPRDTVHIKPKNADEIEIGDVALYRRNNHLFGHRVIRKGKDNGLPYIITRPDTARHGNDGPSFNEDILGIVSNIERRGRILDTMKKDYNLAEKIYLSLILKLYHFRQYFFRKALIFLTYIQQLKFYRKLAKFLFSRTKEKINFSIQIPLNPKRDNRFYRVISPEELICLNLNADKTLGAKWAITLNVSSEQAGFLSFIFRPQSLPFPGWWLSEAKIKVRYRGTAMEEKLCKQANKLLRQSNIARLSASVFKDAYLERVILKNFGFKEIYTYNDKFLKDKVKEHRVRLIMEKKINGSKQTE